MIPYSFMCRIFHRKIIIPLRSKIANEQKSLTRNCTIRRALLYVPGNDIKKITKALTLNVDSIVMDCEDGVALNKKEEARNTIKHFLDQDPAKNSKSEWNIRINPVQTSELCEADINTLLSAKNLPASICLPKVNKVDELQWFAEKVWNKLITRPDKDKCLLKLIMYIESPIAMITLPELCKKAEDLSTMAPIVPVALVFGGDDFLALLGATKTLSGKELLYARQKMVLVAKAFALQAIDMVCINYTDSKLFEEECIEGYAMGYTGKQIIHPAQIDIAHKSFVPNLERIRWAQNVIKNFHEFQQKGQGAFTFENTMIDMPTVKQAQYVIKVAEAAGSIPE